MDSSPYAAPITPTGFEPCRTRTGNVQTTHLLALDINGRNGGRPTVCGMTRFDTRNPDGTVAITAALPGWGIGGGSFGPDVTQIACPACWDAYPTTPQPAPHAPPAPQRARGRHLATAPNVQTVDA